MACFLAARIGSVVGVRNGDNVGEATSRYTCDSSIALCYGPILGFFGLVLVMERQTGQGILTPAMNSCRSWYRPLLITILQSSEGSI